MSCLTSQYTVGRLRRIYVTMLETFHLKVEFIKISHNCERRDTNYGSSTVFTEEKVLVCFLLDSFFFWKSVKGQNKSVLFKRNCDRGQTRSARPQRLLVSKVTALQNSFWTIQGNTVTNCRHQRECSYAHDMYSLSFQTEKKLLENWSSCTQNHISSFDLFLILQATYIARHVSYDFIKFTISTWLQSLHCLINTESLKNILVLRSGIDCCKRKVLRCFWARQSTLIQGIAGKKQAYCQLPTTEKCFSRTLSPLHHVSALCYKGKDSWAQRQTRSPDWNHDIILTLCENRKR